jgi:hypothetical protein
MSIVEEWLDVATQLAVLKQRELELRNKIAPTILGNKQEGSKTCTLDGYKLTAQARLNYSIDHAALAEVYEQLTEEEASCIVFKPDLKIPLYRKLPESSLLRQVVTAKPGQAQLTFKE